MGFSLKEIMHPLERASRKFYNPLKWGKANWADVVLGEGIYGPLQFARDSWAYAYEEFFPQESITQAIKGNKSSNILKVPVIYGEVGKVGGVRAFVNTSGSNNEFLWIVLVVCEGEIEAIDDIYIDDVISTDSKFSGKVTFWRYTGTETQAANSELVATFSEWTSAHQLKGLAYIVGRFKYDSDAFGGFPKITCNVRGKKVYDPRTGVTAYSVTPALHLRDYFLNPMYGKGAPSSTINDASVGTAADFQEILVTEHDGAGAGNVPLLTCNLYLPTKSKIIDNIRLLLKANRCYFPRINGRHQLIIEKDEPSVFSFDESNIIGGWNFSKGDLRSRLNKAEVVFKNKSLGWKDDTVQVVSSTLRAEDNNLTLSRSIQAPWVNDPYHAKDLANIAIKQSRQQLACSFVAAPAALKVIPGSIVDVTHSTPGWTNKTFRVSECSILPFGLIRVSLTEHEPTVYDRDVPVEQPTPPDTNLPDPDNVIAPGAPILSSGDAQLLVAQDGTVISRIKAVWSAPSGYPYVVGYDVEYKKSTDTEWIPAPIVKYSTGLNTHIGPVDDGVSYDVRVRTIGPNDKRSVWVTTAGHTVIGKLAPPGDVDTFTVLRQLDGTRQFEWTHSNPPPDLAGYKIKYKLTSGQPWADLLDLHQGLLTASPFETNLLAAGTYTVGIVAVDTSGNESANPLIINSTLGDPRIAGSVYATAVQSVDPIWDGTKTNCFVDYDSGVLLAADSKDWDSFATDGTDWDNWTTWARSPATSFTYEHPSATTAIDLGAIVSFTPLVSVDGVGTLTVEEQHSDDDITYTSWAVAGSLVTARYIRFRVTDAESVLTGTLSKMDINLSADPVDEYINDLDTSTISSPAGVFRLPITRSYATITQVTLALQNVGAGWSWELIDKDPSLGPQIKIYNGSGVLADATIDAVVRGI